MTWETTLSAYIAYLTAIGRPKTTIDLRRFQIAYMAKSINKQPAAITYEDLIEWFALHDEWKPETRRSYRSGIRGFYGWAVAHHHAQVDPSLAIPQIRVPQGQPRPAPEIVYPTALTNTDPRTALMLRLAAEAGLRRAEVAKVHTKDVRYGPAGAQLLVHGKGNRERVVPITDDLARLVAAGSAGYTPGGCSIGWLFPSERGGHVTAPWVGTKCSEALGEGCTMHQLRHLFASKAYRGTRNIRAVQGLLGHANLAITERYTACDDDERRAAMMAAVA
jgi:integrase